MTAEVHPIERVHDFEPMTGDLLFTSKQEYVLHRLILRFAPPFVHAGVFASSAWVESSAHRLLDVFPSDTQPDPIGYVFEGRHGGPTITRYGDFIHGTEPATDPASNSAQNGLGAMRSRSDVAAAVDWAAAQVDRRTKAGNRDGTQYAYDDLALAVHLGFRAKIRRWSVSTPTDDLTEGLGKALIGQANELAKAAVRSIPTAVEPELAEAKSGPGSWTCATFAHATFATMPGLLVPRLPEGVRVTAANGVFDPSAGEADPTFGQWATSQLFGGAAPPGERQESTFKWQMREHELPDGRTAEVCQGFSSLLRTAIQLGFIPPARALLYGRQSVPVDRALAASDLWNTESDWMRFATRRKGKLPKVASEGVSLPSIMSSSTGGLP